MKEEKSRPIQVQGSLRQGGVLSVTLFAKMMDSLSEELIEFGKGVKYGETTIPNLLLVDDVAIMAESKNDMTQMLKIVEDFRKRNRLSLSAKKTKMMIINKKEEDCVTEWKIGEMKIDTVTQYTYLGELIDSNCTMTPHLENKKRKMMAMTDNIIGITKEEVLMRTRPKMTLELYEKTIIPAALYGCETWSLTNNEIKKVEDIQTQTLKKLMKLPQSTPNIAVLGEYGFCKMEHRIHKRQLDYLHKLRNGEDNRWTTIVLTEDLQIGSEGENISNKMEATRIQYEIKDPMGIYSREWKQMTKQKIKQIADKQYTEEAAGKRKMEDLNKYKTEIKREEYLEQLNWKDARTIFKIRTRMSNLAANYKGSNENTMCKICGNAQETEKHIIDECQQVNKDAIRGITYQNIIENSASTKDLEKIAKFMRDLTEEDDQRIPSAAPPSVPT